MDLIKHAKLYFLNEVNISKNANISMHETTSFKKNELIIDNGSHFVKIGANSEIRRCHIVIEGNNNQLLIGNNCKLGHLIIEILGDNCIVKIGDKVKNTGPGKWSCRERGTVLSIGSRSLIATGVTMLTSDGHDIYFNNERSNHASNIIIGEHVWIGQETILLKGSNIGDGCVIGARSMVTKPIPPHKIAAGSPCKIIKDGVEWDETLSY